MNMLLEREREGERERERQRERMREGEREREKEREGEKERESRKGRIVKVTCEGKTSFHQSILIYIHSTYAEN